LKFGISQGFSQMQDPGAIDLGDVGMNVRHILGGFRQTSQDFGFLALHILHPGFHRRLIQAILDRGHHPGDATFDLGQRPIVDFHLSTTFMVLVVELLRKSPHGICHSISGNQLVGQPRQNTTFDIVTAHGMAVGAGAATVSVQTTVPVACDDAVLTAAASAGQQARQQKRRTAQFVDMPGASRPHAPGGCLELPFQFGLTGPGRRPGFIIDDPQFRNLGSDPLGFRVDPRNPLAGSRVLDIAQAVPDQDAGIELIVENAGPSADMAANGGIAPVLCERTGDAVAIEVTGNRTRAFAGSKLPENPPHDDGLGLVDFPLPAHRLAIAVEAFHHIIAVA